MITPSPMWGIISILLLVALCLTSVPVAVSMGSAGAIFALLYYGSMSGVILVGLTAWAHSASYMASMIPLFVFIGALIASADLGKDAYDCFYKWLSKIRASLAIVTTLTCALFGAITGSTSATIATVGAIGNNEMKRHGYSAKLRLGTIAAASTVPIRF